MVAETIFVLVGQMLFAVFGACVKWLNARKQDPSTLFLLGVEAASAAFAGCLVYCVYSAFEFNTGFAFALAGIVGYQGTKGIDKLGQWIIRHLNLNDSENNKSECNQP